MIRKPLLHIGACVLAVACGSAVLPGCSSPSYVNIPGQAGDVARNNPNAGDVITIMSKAIAAAVEAEGLDGVYEVLLPEGSNQQTYQEVVLRLGGGAITPDTLREAPVPSVAVAGVRVRNRNAEVDIVRPSPTGRAAVEVQLFWYYGDAWQVERVRPLRLSVEALGWEVPTEGAPRPVPPGVEMPDVAQENAESESEPVPPADAEPDA